LDIGGALDADPESASLELTPAATRTP
jgi:hypothetical protein